METPEKASFKLRTAETILGEVEEIYDFVTRRACEIFLDRSGISTLSIEDWLTAEKEVLWKPEVWDVARKPGVLDGNHEW